MADFATYAPFLKRWEGGFVNDPRDPGGATYMGVTLATYRQHYGEDKTATDLRRIKAAEWTAIMRTYWDRCKGDKIKRQGVAEMLVDWHINAGGIAIKAAQRALGCTPDGLVGPKTLAALNKAGSFALLRAARERYYQALAATKPAMYCFLPGWLNRTRAIVDR